MNTENLIAYLKDHYAGSVAGVALTDHLVGISEEPSLHRFFAELRMEIRADQKTLHELLMRLGYEESMAGIAMGWVGEKMAWIRMFLSDTKKGGIGRFEGIEVLFLGIVGKKELWRALANIAHAVPELGKIDFNHLIQRAEEQCVRVEEKRLEAAKEAFL